MNSMHNPVPPDEVERLDRLRKDIADGLDSRPAEPWGPEEINRAGRARLKAADKKPLDSHVH